MDLDERKSLIQKFAFVLIMTIILVAGISINATYYFLGEKVRGQIKIEKSEHYKSSIENIDSIANTLKNIRKKINQEYKGEINEETILNETIKGYVNGLDDEYSEYMTKKEWEEYALYALGNYVGIGVYMGEDKNGNIVVISPIEETPAMKAGLKSEDIIIEIDGKTTLEMSVDEASSMIKGEPGTKVKIKILRGTEYIDYEIERKEIKVYHVTTEMKEGNIGYIRLSTFDEGCSEEFKTKYEELKKQGAKKIIIDLRYNTGGLVEEALSIADMMIPKNETLLITVDSQNNKEQAVAKTDRVINEEIVVLVNGYSASASEILAGAVKDHDVATIVGTKTYGKGVIQSVFTLNDGSILKLTTNEYFTPNEIKINKEGITPDYVVEIGEDVPEDVDPQLDKAIELLK